MTFRTSFTLHEVDTSSSFFSSALLERYMFQIGEIVWGRMRGFPWWPARIVTPTPDQLTHLSVTNIPPDHRLVWFFNDNDRYTLLNVKSLSPFSNPELTVQTKKKTGKTANKLKLAFNQAAAEHHLAVHPVLVHPPHRKPPHRKPPQISKSSNHSTQLVSPTPQSIPPETRNSTHRNTNSTQHPTDSQCKPVSKRRSTTKFRLSPDDQSDPLSAKSTPSPSDRSSQQTTNDLPPSKAAPKRNLLRLRIREPHSVKTQHRSHKPPIPSKNTHNQSHENNHSSSNPERSRRVTKPSLKLRREASQKDDVPVKRRKRQTSHDGVKRIKLETSGVQSPDPKFQSQRDVTSRGRDFPISNEQPLSESKLSIRSQKVRGLEKTSRSQFSIQRSRRGRKMNNKNDESNDDSAVESEDEIEPPVGSKRSRDVEAPRLSDGQRRLHIRRGGKSDLRTARQEDADHKRRAAQRAKRVVLGNASDEPNEFAARPFEALTKDQCVTIIRGMQEALRCKNVRIWLQGYQLVKAEEVKRTEKDLIKACESGIGKAEKLLGWAKRHQDYDLDAGSRFARMEERAVQECRALIDVYFDRRKVSLREIGSRVFQLTKELPTYSRTLTSVLNELLVLWVDLTSSRS